MCLLCTLNSISSMAPSKCYILLTIIEHLHAFKNYNCGYKTLCSLWTVPISLITKQLLPEAITSCGWRATHLAVCSPQPQADRVMVPCRADSPHLCIQDSCLGRASDIRQHFDAWIFSIRTQRRGLGRRFRGRNICWVSVKIWAGNLLTRTHF